MADVRTPRASVPPQCGRCRRFFPPLGDTVHFGRGLCGRCWTKLDEDERLDHEPTTRHRDDVLDDWLVLREEGHTKAQAAERLGMTFEAFDRAFHRARAAGDPRALPALTTKRVRQAS